ncbi:MAG: AsmA family protein [Flagellimonas sp.]
MPQNNKSRILKIGVGLLLLFILAGVAAQLFFTKKVKKVLSEQVPKEINLMYSEVSTNVFLGKISLTDINASSPDGQINFEAKSVTVSGLRYLPLLQNGDIALGDITLESPKLVQHQKEKDTTSKKDNKAPSKKYSVDKVSIKNGSYTFLNQKLDSVATLASIDFNLSDINFDEKTAKENIPFTYGDYELQTGKGYYNLSALEFIEFQNMQLNPDDGEFHQLVLRTKYSKAELSKRLVQEHDHYDLSIDDITLKDWGFGIENDLPYFYLGHMQLQQPIFHVYRDKLLPDDTTHKKLYNQALRDLKLDLHVDSIQISKGLITYKERLEADVDPEQLSFTDIQATINNLHTKGKGDVAITVNAKLMDNGPFTLDWSFDPQNKANAFLVKGSLSNFQSESISPFLKTNLNAEVKGSIQQMYFTISGNELESQGDMKMKYDDFEFTVLKKDGLGVNKILTAVVNLFTKKGEKTDDDGFRHGDFKVERKQAKSFFNYLWINLQEGLVDTMTGRGKKRD